MENNKGNNPLLREFTKDCRKVFQSRFLLYSLTSSVLKVRYQRSFLGFFWSLLNPILGLAIIAVVFGNLMRGIENYPLYLFCGMIPFQAFSESVSMGCASLLRNEALIKRTSVCKLVFPLSSLGIVTFNFVATMLALFGLLFFFIDIPIHLPLIIIPAAIVLLLAMSLGVMLIIMTLGTYFRDVEHMIGVILRALYFISPVIIKPQQLGKYEFLMKYNPLTYYLRLFRDPIYNGIWPSNNTWIITISGAVMALVAGYVVYKKFEDDYVFRL